MSSVPFISDFWLLRGNRFAGALADGDPLREVNERLWRSFKEEHRNIPVRDGDDIAEIDVYSVQHGPTRAEAVYDWRHAAGSYTHAQRLLAAHASLRCALARTESDRIVGAAAVNIRDLTPVQLGAMCAGIVNWWDSTERTYASPFSQLAPIMRNWLQGVYGGAPLGRHPSLDAVRELEIDHREVLVETARAMAEILTRNGVIDEGARILVVGEGLWAESVTVELCFAGMNAHNAPSLETGVEAGAVMLLGAQDALSAEAARAVPAGAIIELLPDQVKPEADSVLEERGVATAPDYLCACARDIVDDWWMRGKPTPTWMKALELRLEQLWKDVAAERESSGATWRDAALRLALSRLDDRWNESDALA